MITLEVADLVIIAGGVLGLDTAEVLDLLDPAAAGPALAQVRPDDDRDGLAGPAAVLLCALVRGQPLRRGNQQVALAAMLQFLALNGSQLDPDPPEAIAALVADVASGPSSAADAAAWLALRLQPAAGVKEEPMRVRPALSLAGRIRKATARPQSTGTGAFRRFTDRARRAIYLATEEARLLRHGYIGTEHLLLGVLLVEESLAAEALEALGLSVQQARQRVMEIATPGQQAPPRHIPFTPRARKVVELSLREALGLGHNYVGPEHLLLALLREKFGIGAQVVTGLGASYDQVRESVAELARQREQAAQGARRARRPHSAELADAEQQLSQVRAQKEAALDAEDFDAARALRDRERDLLAAKARLERQLDAAPPPDDLEAALAENERLRRELGRLRGVLRDHGIEPDGGTARPA